MRKLFSQKNNKEDLGAHIFSLHGPTSHEGWLVRLEARSWRKTWSGENSWDVFYIVPAVPGSGQEDEYSVDELHGINHWGGIGDATPIARYNGRSSFLFKKQREETPFGPEFNEIPLKLRGIPFEDCGPREIQYLAEAVILASVEGFGPHGEYKNLPTSWAEEMLSSQEDSEE